MRFFTNKQAPTLFQGKLIKNNIKLFIGLKKGNHKRLPYYAIILFHNTFLRVLTKSSISIFLHPSN